jgi:hypothetical protein
MSALASSGGGFEASSPCALIVDGSFLHTLFVSTGRVLDPSRLVNWCENNCVQSPECLLPEYRYWVEPISEAAKNFRTKVKETGVSLSLRFPF